MSLKPQHAQVYLAIKDYVRENGYSPTYREIAAITGKSPGYVHRLVMELEENGNLNSGNGKHREITLTKDIVVPSELLDALEEFSNGSRSAASLIALYRRYKQGEG